MNHSLREFLPLIERTDDELVSECHKLKAWLDSPDWCRNKPRSVAAATKRLAEAISILNERGVKF